MVYWAKADSSGLALSIEDHLGSVAQVARKLVLRDPHLLALLRAYLGLEKADVLDYVAFIAGIHDVGKVASGFQERIPELAPEPPGGPYHRRIHHTLVYDVLLGHFKKVDDLPGTRNELRRALAPSIHHHGYVRHHTSYPSPTVNQVLRPSEVEEAERLWRLMKGRYPGFDASLRAWIQNPAPSGELEFALAGLIVLADWIASTVSFFPLKRPEELGHPWSTAELHELAETAVATIFPTLALKDCNPKQLLPPSATPSALQLEAWRGLIRGELMIIEDQTGSGKTEAALGAVFNAMSNDPSIQGFYWAMPTKATANALLSRLERAILDHDVAGEVSLQHGDRLQVLPLLYEGRPKMDEGIQEGRAWISDHQKTGLLAPYGLGTIDQLLRGVLREKHQNLRLLAAQRKVLILDEIHSYDQYMSMLIERLLAFCRRMRVPVILLSATLASSVRQRFLSAWEADQTEPMDAYPLCTRTFGGSIRLCPLPEPHGVAKRIEIQSNRSEVLGEIGELVRNGAMAGWVCNTVQSAIETYREAINRGIPARLLHSRFVRADRLERESLLLEQAGPNSTERPPSLWIGTQVLEQSLDVDFDVLVSELAPVEVLLQRLGRLHRHHGRVRPKQVENPVMTLVAPPRKPDASWLNGELRGTVAVYRNPSALWRTMELIEEQGPSCFHPRMSRAWIEFVYGDYPIPIFLAKAQAEAEAEGAGKQFIAKEHMVQFEEGYSGWLPSEDATTRLAEPTLEAIVLGEDGQPLRGDSFASQVRVPLKEARARKWLEEPDGAPDWIRIPTSAYDPEVGLERNKHP